MLSSFTRRGTGWWLFSGRESSERGGRGSGAAGERATDTHTHTLTRCTFTASTSDRLMHTTSPQRAAVEPTITSGSAATSAGHWHVRRSMSAVVQNRSVRLWSSVAARLHGMSLVASSRSVMLCTNSSGSPSTTCRGGAHTFHVSGRLGVHVCIEIGFLPRDRDSDFQLNVPIIHIRSNHPTRQEPKARPN
jgi:hypothetical protein